MDSGAFIEWVLDHVGDLIDFLKSTGPGGFAYQLGGHIAQRLIPAIQATEQKFLNALLRFVGWLINLGVQLTAQLPRHTPIPWPDPGNLGVFFRGLVVVNRFVDIPAVFAVFGTMFLFEAALLVYAAYRALLGIVPTAK